MHNVEKLANVESYAAVLHSKSQHSCVTTPTFQFILSPHQTIQIARKQTTLLCVA